MNGVPIDGIVVGVVVVLAVTFVGRRLFAAVRSARSATAGCATDCGCGSSTPSGSDWSKS